MSFVYTLISENEIKTFSATSWLILCESWTTLLISQSCWRVWSAWRTIIKIYHYSDLWRQPALTLPEELAFLKVHCGIRGADKRVLPCDPATEVSSFQWYKRINQTGKLKTKTGFLQLKIWVFSNYIPFYLFGFPSSQTQTNRLTLWTPEGSH